MKKVKTYTKISRVLNPVEPKQTWIVITLSGDFSDNKFSDTEFSETNFPTPNFSKQIFRWSNFRTDKFSEKLIDIYLQ